MGDEGPHLFANKPKRSKLKASTPPPSPPSPPPPHSKGFFRSRSRVLVPLLLTLNFGIGAYVLVKTTIRDRRLLEEEVPEEYTSSTSTSTSIHAAQPTTADSRGSTA